MKIESLRFKNSVYLKNNGMSQHSHLESARWDIELHDYRYVIVRAKNLPKILAIVPFENCSALYPLDETELQSLDELEEAISSEETEETNGSDMMEVIPMKKKGRPTYAEVAERRRLAANL